MKCEFCDANAKTRVPQPMCTLHAEEFWRCALAWNRMNIERREVQEELKEVTVAV